MRVSVIGSNRRAADQPLEYARWLGLRAKPLTEEELARVEAGDAEIRRGDYVTLDDVKRRLAL